jgi:hypothetical protein
MMRVPIAWLDRQDQVIAERRSHAGGDHEAYVA